MERPDAIPSPSRETAIEPAIARKRQGPSPRGNRKLRVNGVAIIQVRHEGMDAAMQVKRFNWMRSPSAWDQLQAWQERRKAMRADFESASSTAASAFGSALTSQASGLADLAGQAALDRVKAATTAKLDTIA
jgi:hypothetical protein